MQINDKSHKGIDSFGAFSLEVLYLLYKKIGKERRK